MITQIPKEITVQIDSREKYPLSFPANIRIDDPDNTFKKIIIPVATEVIKLDIGDYRLAEYPDCCVIERKASQREIYKNLFNPRDQIRQAKAFRKLATVEHPLLLIELSPSALLYPNPDIICNPESLLHRLSMVIAKYRLHVIWAPHTRSGSVRKNLGLTLVHLMLGYALRTLIDVPVSVPETVQEDVYPDEDNIE